MLNFLKRLFGTNEPTTSQLNAILVPLRDQVCDMKDDTKISWMTILPIVQDVAFRLVAETYGVSAALKVLSAASIKRYLPENIPLNSLRELTLSPAAQPEQMVVVEALVQRIADDMIKSGHPVKHVAQAFSSFAVMTAARVAGPTFAAAIVAKSFERPKRVANS